MKKMICSVCLIISILVSGMGSYAMSYPSSNMPSLRLDNNINEIEPRYGFSRWKVISVDKNYSTGYESTWRSGPEGKGPGSLSINESTSINRSFTTSITAGTGKPGVSTLSAAIGVTIGSSETHGTSYTITLKSGESKQIIFRAVYRIYRVYSEYRSYDQQDNYEVKDTDYTNVAVFDHWAYDWRNV